MKDSYDEGLEDIENFDEISNLCEGSEDESEIDNFKNFEVDIEKFKETLFPRVDVEDQKVHNQFSCTILYALRFDKTGFKDKCDKQELKKVLIKVLFKNLLTNLNLLSIYKNFITCVMKPSVLSKYNYFLRVFELKNKYRRFSMKASKATNG